MVNVQQTSLGTFKQNFFLLSDRIQQIGIGVDNMILQLLGITRIFFVDRVDIQGLCFRIEGLKNLVFVGDDFFQATPEKLGTHQIPHPDSVRSARFITVAGPDSPHGCADRFFLATLLENHFFLHMIGKNHVGPVTDQQPTGFNRTILLNNGGHFL